MKHLSEEEFTTPDTRQRKAAAGEASARGGNIRLDELRGRLTIEEHAQRGRQGGMRTLLEMVPASPPTSDDAI